MNFWKSTVIFLGISLVSTGLFFADMKQTYATAPLNSTFTATAPTGALGTIRQIRVDPADGTHYVLGSVTDALGVISADGSSYSSANYSVALPSHTGSDIAVSNGRVFIVTHGGGSANAVYRYDVSGAIATLVATSYLTSGASAITLGNGGSTIYTSKSLSLSSFDTNLSRITPTSTLTSAPSRLAYGGGLLFYLSTTGRFMSAILDVSDTTIATGGPTAATVKGFVASNDGSALYYASTSTLSKLLVASGTVLWTKPISNIAGLDVNTSTGRITVIDSSGMVTTYNPIDALSSVSSTASSTSAILSWITGALDADFGGVTIRRSTSGYPTSATEGVAVTSSSMATSLTDTGLDEGTYYYSFFNQTVDGYYSTAATSSVMIDLPPEAPTLAVEATGSTISLSWSVPADTDTFMLRRDTTDFPASYTDGSTVTTTASSVTSLTQNSLPDGIYYYSIFARDSGGNYSSPGTASATIDTISPSAPTLNAITSGSSILLSWDTPPTTASFLLRRSTSGFPTTIFEGTAVTSTTATSIVNASLIDGAYYYSIFARDSYDNYSNAGTASATIDTTAPSAPTSFSAVASGSTINLTWSNPFEGDFASSTIRRSTIDFPTSVTDGTAVTSTVATSYTDQSLADDTYYYSIFAADITGNSSIQATSSATVDTYVAPTVPATSSGGGGGFSSVAPSAANAVPLGFSVSNGFSKDTAVSVSSPTVKLQLNANPSTVRGYAASLDPSFKNANIIPLNASGEAVVSIPNVAGTYTVYLKYYSTTGQSSNVISQTVTYTPLQNQASVSAPVTKAKATPTFARILQQGDRGADVKALQVFLNTRGFIVVKNGPGSPGNETPFFGPATTKAVKKFQEANKNVILKPYNLEKGTGIFGAKMREFINSMK